MSKTNIIKSAKTIQQVSVEEAEKVIAAELSKKAVEFNEKLNALIKEYNAYIIPTIELSGQVINIQSLLNLKISLQTGINKK